MKTMYLQNSLIKKQPLELIKVVQQDCRKTKINTQKSILFLPAITSQNKIKNAIFFKFH